jgi:putative glutathione S-transferase
MWIDDQWGRDYDPVDGADDMGSFVREAPRYRNWITVDGSPGPTGEMGFKAEPGRYHLYVALTCPWASRTLMAYKLKRLERVVGVTVLDPRLTENVWRFGSHQEGFPGSEPDPLYGAEYLSELYLRSDPSYTGQVSVPVLWDRLRQVIVNNESADIVRMFDGAFDGLSDSSVKLYPTELCAEIKAVSERLCDRFNNGFYRAGFATTELAHERVVQDVLESLDWLEHRLDGEAYLVGGRLTEADLCAFVTLVRFELAFQDLFKTSLRQLRYYPNLRAYVRRIHAVPGIAETVAPDHIKAGYHSMRDLTPAGHVSLRPAAAW